MKNTLWRVVVPAIIVLAAALWGCQTNTASRPARADAAREVSDATANTANDEDAAPEQRAKGKAVFPEKVADMGDVIKGDQAEHVFKVRNEGEGVLRILKARGS